MAVADSRSTHLVQFYDSEPFLYRAIADFYAEAAEGAQLLMIARPRTFEAVAGRVPDGIRFVNADEALAGIMDGDAIHPTRCDQSLARLLLETRLDRDHRTVRIYGEMSDLLCSRGHHAVAIDLETRWNHRFGGDSRISTFCGYGIGRFDADPDSASLRKVCGQHTHVLATEVFADVASDGQFERAVLLQHRARTSTVYVVDDDASVRRSLARLVASLGFRVRTFESAEVFLLEVDNPLTGCLILDLQLLGMTGPELQSRLDAARWPLPVIAMSGSHDPQLEADALRLGARAFLPKPFEPDALFNAIVQAQLQGPESPSSAR